MRIEQGVPGFTQYNRYHLTRRESSQRHHSNLNFAKWHRANIDERVVLEAKAANFDAWLVFDVDETLLAQGCFSEGMN